MTSNIFIALIVFLMIELFSPSSIVSHIAFLALGPAILYASIKFLIDKKLKPFPHYIPVISLVLVSIFYKYDFLVQYDFITHNQDLRIAFKQLESLGMAGFTYMGIYLTVKHSDYSATLIDFSAMVFSAATILLIANWTAVSTYFASVSTETAINTLNLIGACIFGAIFISQPILERFKKNVTVVTTLAITMACIHYVFELVITKNYATYAAPELIKRLSLASFNIAAIVTLWIFSFLPFEPRNTMIHSKFVEFSTPYSIILPFVAVISLTIVPVYAVTEYVNNSAIPYKYILGVQLVISALYLVRFGVLTKKLLKKTRELRHAAFHDLLTEVLNRRGLNQAYQKLQLLRKDNEHFCIAYIDINEFTAINNSYGHSAGDFVLKTLADSLNKLKNTRAVARLGGDEFVIVFSYTDTPPYTSSELREELNQWVEYGNQSIYLSLSTGLTRASDDTLDDALENADIAMYSAKLNRISENKTNRSEALKPYRQHVKELLQSVIEKREPTIFVQPIYSLHSYKIVAAEVLTRLEDNRGNIVMPDAFISVARDNRQLELFDAIVIESLKEVIDQIPCQIHINLSPDIINNLSSAKRYADFIKKVDIPLNRITFEITEKEHIDHINLEHSIHYLHQCGLRFALDDFGTGYSSLDRVANFPIDSIKLDGSLLRAARRGNPAAVYAAVSLAQHLGASTTMECIESAEDIKLCRQVGSESVQGFYLCPPIRLNEFIKRYSELEYFNILTLEHEVSANQKSSVIH